MRAFDAYKILDEQEAGSLIDLIAPCMDDYLYHKIQRKFIWNKEKIKYPSAF